MFKDALWGHIHGMPPTCYNAANVDPPSLVGGLPRAGGGSLTDSKPPPPSDAANVARSRWWLAGGYLASFTVAASEAYVYGYPSCW
jgi:hypothetical protein